MNDTEIKVEKNTNMTTNSSSPAAAATAGGAAAPAAAAANGAAPATEDSGMSRTCTIALKLHCTAQPTNTPPYLPLLFPPACPAIQSHHHHHHCIVASLSLRNAMPPLKLS